MIRTNHIVILLIILFHISILESCRKSEYLLEEHELIIADDGSGVGTVTWTSDKTYTLDGFVFVNDGQVLTIEAGTIIRAKTGQADRASALIVSRGGQIIAEGTREQPIIFTVEGDDLAGSVPVESRGLWGGIIILGNAPIHNASGEASIEGIPFYEPRGIYGGYNEDDNSGMIKYVSIRHGGTNIGEGNEINGLTLAGVGRGTEVDYVEIISNEDDGLEIFGGTVNFKHIFIAFCGDDAFDYDMGFIGKGQFLVGIQKEGLGDKLFENGGNRGEGLLTSHPVFYNLTLFGQGYNSQKPLISFLENSAGEFYNSLFVNQGRGIELEKIDHNKSSFQEWKDGNIAVSHCWFFNVANNQPDDILFLSGGYTQQDQADWSEYFRVAQNKVKSAEIGIINSRYFIQAISVPWDENQEYKDPWFDPVSFKGAFGTVNWAADWTLFDQEGLFGE